MCFQLDIPSGNCAIYGCSLSRVAPGVSQYRSNSGRRTMLQLLVVLNPCILADYSLLPTVFLQYTYIQHFSKIGLMLISHSWYTFNSESAYKKLCFIKVAVFVSDVILVSNYQICKAKERQ